MITRTKSLRVAIVASSLSLAGAEKQTFYMARTLLNAGVDAQFFYLGGGGHYEAPLRQAGLPVRQIYVPNRPCTMLARLMGALWRLRPHIVFAPQFGDLRFAVPAGRICGALVLGGVRSDGFYELNRHGRLSRWLFRLTHGVIANSFHARENLASQKINPQKIGVLPNVIDLQEFDRQAALHSGICLPPDRIIAVAVGSLQSCKRFDRFLEALALARRSEPALAGVIAGGDRGAKAELQARSNALGLTPDDVVFLGEVNQIPALLARSAFLVLTSDYEGFPNVILEAMAARLPVITTAAGDAGRVVLHGQTGYVVEREDIPAMAAQMIELTRSPALRWMLGQAGREHIEQKYNCEGLANLLMAIFHRFARLHRKHSLCELLEHGAPAKKYKASSRPLILERPAA